MSKDRVLGLLVLRNRVYPLTMKARKAWSAEPPEVNLAGMPLSRRRARSGIQGGKPFGPLKKKAQQLSQRQRNAS